MKLAHQQPEAEVGAEPLVEARPVRAEAVVDACGRIGPQFSSRGRSRLSQGAGSAPNGLKYAAPLVGAVRTHGVYRTG